MNDVMKWTTDSEITNMYVIKLEDDESLINNKKTMMGPLQSLLDPSTFYFVLPALIDET